MRAGGDNDRLRVFLFFGVASECVCGVSFSCKLVPQTGWMPRESDSSPLRSPARPESEFLQSIISFHDLQSCFANGAGPRGSPRSIFKIGVPVLALPGRFSARFLSGKRRNRAAGRMWRFPDRNLAENRSGRAQTGPPMLKMDRGDLLVSLRTMFTPGFLIHDFVDRRSSRNGLRIGLRG